MAMVPQRVQKLGGIHYGFVARARLLQAGHVAFRGLVTVFQLDALGCTFKRAIIIPAQLNRACSVGGVNLQRDVN